MKMLRRQQVVKYARMHKRNFKTICFSRVISAVLKGEPNSVPDAETRDSLLDTEQQVTAETGFQGTRPTNSTYLAATP
jgi:hypothetical protein